MPQQRHASALALLALVGDRVLPDVDPAAVDARGRALQREFLGVAVELLQQRAAHAEGDVVGGVAGAGHAFEDRTDAGLFSSFSLSPSSFFHHLFSLSFSFLAERLFHQLHALVDHFYLVSLVVSYASRLAGGDHFVLQRLAPLLADGVEDVVAVRHHRDDRAGLRELRQHVAVGVDFALAAPAGDLSLIHI